VVTNGGHAGPLAASAPRASRIDVVCGPDVLSTVLALTGRWAEERAVAEVARARLTALVRAAMEHGLRFDPRGVTMLIEWLDPGHVRLDVRWHGSAGTASTPVEGGDVGATISTLDTLAERWGFGSSGGDPVHWMVVDVG
jgi:hypothetical protein